ncbi:DUF2381 family protein [Corallococcus carmarthensis]|uniref:DUF2381 family protein n=1 Tax=Corallococcus carmarthensis TaxID=2316728 RepID=A0A3A8JU19_9BACT|nr:DUF2381 family protein [Corallococcus carmarthensis]RKG98466.1 DUF2381 family protein [Corallococcus carmarthensis]
MLQPLRLALPLAIALAWGAVARAQPAARIRAERQRSVTIASTPAEPLPVVRVARDTLTLLFFPSPIQKKTLTFDESRIRVLDAGERSVIIQPVANLGDVERQEIGVFFDDGRAPARAAFVLVTDPAEVDSRIDVQRPELPNTTCPPSAQAPAPKPEDFVLLGYVDEHGVATLSQKGRQKAAQGLTWGSIVTFRGTGWILADVQIMNEPGHPVWTPHEATFVGRLGAPLRARLVAKKPGPIPPGERGRFLVVVEAPAMEAELIFTLEVGGDGGRRLTIPGVRFPKPSGGATP